MKIEILFAVILASSFATRTAAQEAKPSPSPQAGFKRQVYEPGSTDPLANDPQNVSPELSTRYDRFTDVTTVFISFDDLYVSAHHDLRITAFFTYRGNATTPTKPEVMGITLESTPHDWSYRLEREELFVLADGERFPLGRPSARDAKSDFKYVHTTTEWLEYRMPLAVLKKIASAERVEMRVGQFEFTLMPGFILSMRQLVARIPNPKPASGPIKRRPARKSFQ